MEFIGIIFGILVLLVIGAVILAMYFLPSFIARDKKDFQNILLVNVLLGCTVLGWIFALIWSLTSEEIRPERPAPDATTQALHQPDPTTQAHDRGFLTDHEYELISRRFKHKS